VELPLGNLSAEPLHVRMVIKGMFIKRLIGSIMAEIQFVLGVNETVIPEVRLTRAKDGTNGRAYFYFEDPQILKESKLEILGMYMVDEEGELVSRDVNAKFVNGLAKAIEATYTMKSTAEWDRFIRFMDRYAASHGMGLSQTEE
jgi:photosystem II protein